MEDNSLAIPPSGFEDLSLSIPPPPGGTEINIDLTPVINAERRLHEIAYVNRETAGSLMVVLNEGYGEAGKILAMLRLEHTRALRDANKRKSIVMLEVAPKKLQELKLTNSKSPAGSADLRQSVLDMDDEWLELMDRANLIEAVADYVKAKQKTLDNGIWNTRKVIDPHGRPVIGSLSMPKNTPDSVEAGMTVGAFGTARY